MNKIPSLKVYEKQKKKRSKSEYSKLKLKKRNKCEYNKIKIETSMMLT